MSKSFRKDLTGQRFGRLTVLEFVSNKKKDAHWLCHCDCGNEKVVRGMRLKIGHTTSCGCFRLEKIHSLNGINHGGKGSKLYTIWVRMKQRCLNPNDKSYKDYGGRGICIAPEWLNDFAAFRDWALSHGYKDNLSIDRIDNDRGYFPENCRFADAKTQSRNRRISIFVEYDAKKVCLSEAAELLGIKLGTLRKRYHHGDRDERLFRPVQKQNKPTKEDG